MMRNNTDHFRCTITRIKIYLHFFFWHGSGRALRELRDVCLSTGREMSRFGRHNMSNKLVFGEAGSRFMNESALHG